MAFNRNLDIPPKVGNINIGFYTFVKIGYYVIGIADKSLKSHLDYPNWYKSKYIANNYFTEVVYADPVIVGLSYIFKCPIITNDKYRQYEGTELEEWLNKVLIPFKIIDDKFNLVAKRDPYD